MVPWRVARSLESLRAQVNAAHPARSKASDGTIGDTAHAATVSDHNPDAGGVVRALDLTHDPAHGVDAGDLAEQLRLSRDPRLKYVIADRRIFAGNAGPQPWVWRAYAGTDPHTSHVHVSVLPGTPGDTTGAFNLTRSPSKITPTPGKAFDMATLDDLKRALREVLAEEETARQLFTGHAIVKDTRPGGNPAKRVSPSALLEQAAK